MLTRSVATMNATKVKLAYLVCAGVFLLAGDAVAQKGGKAIPKTTISLGGDAPCSPSRWPAAQPHVR